MTYCSSFRSIVHLPFHFPAAARPGCAHMPYARPPWPATRECVLRIFMRIPQRWNAFCAFCAHSGPGLTRLNAFCVLLCAFHSTGIRFAHFVRIPSPCCHFGMRFAHFVRILLSGCPPVTFYLSLFVSCRIRPPNFQPPWHIPCLCPCATFIAIYANAAASMHRLPVQLKLS